MKTPNAQSRQHLILSRVAVNTAYGDHPAALFGGIATRLSCRTMVSGLQINHPDQSVEIPYTAASEEFSETLSPELRLQLLYQGAFQRFSDLTSDPADTLIVTLLPISPHMQNPDVFVRNLSTHAPHWAKAQVKQSAITESSSQFLQAVLEEFSQGHWKQLVFGAGDCLVGTNTLLAAMQQGACCSNLNPDRRLLGEGAAFLIIEKKTQPSAGQIVIRAIDHQPEPNSGQAATETTLALTNSIQACLTQGNATINDVDCLITGYIPDMPGTLEWHQTERTLWPETGRRPRAIEELNPHLGIGDCGAANLPLGLALASARFDFSYEPVTSILVCDFGPQPHRGAVLLQRYPGEQMKTQED